MVQVLSHVPERHQKHHYPGRRGHSDRLWHRPGLRHSQHDPLLEKRLRPQAVRTEAGAAVVRVYVEVFRGTPMVLQAVFIYYGLPYFTDGQVSFSGNSGIWLASIIVVSINTGAYMAESVRGGIISIDPGQTEGAMAIGMTHVQTMTSVILPQAIRNIIPQIGNNFIINIKDTSVMFIISFTEFFAAHRYIVGVNNMYFPSAAIEMLGYLCMTLAASALLRLAERYAPFSGILAGFILPKLFTENCARYVAAIRSISRTASYFYMPVLESASMLPLETRHAALAEVRDRLAEVSDTILNIRVGETTCPTPSACGGRWTGPSTTWGRWRPFCWTL